MRRFVPPAIVVSYPSRDEDPAYLLQVSAGSIWILKVQGKGLTSIPTNSLRYEAQ